MTITARFPMVHLCPYAPEVDVGEVDLTWPGEAPDLHKVAADLASYHGEAITHEDLTDQLARGWGALVVTRWRTAGAEVTVTVDGCST